MRKLIVCNIVSLDGFFAGPGGNVMVMPFDDGFSDYNAERLRAADTLLLGRKSYEGFRSYWPGIAEDASQPAVEREISHLNTAMEKVVVSDSLSRDERRLAARLQECFAGMLEHADAQIGRVLDWLEHIGKRNDTLVMLLSDNGGTMDGDRKSVV